MDLVSGNRYVLWWDKWGVDYIWLHNLTQYQYTATTITSFQAMREWLWCHALWSKLWYYGEALLPKTKNPINCSIRLGQVSSLWCAATAIKCQTIQHNQPRKINNRTDIVYKSAGTYPKTTEAEEFVVIELPTIVSKCIKSDT